MCDICMHMCMYLGLLHELGLSVCECGRGRPSACQYVLMLHIWFPNFTPSLPPSSIHPPCPPSLPFSSPPPQCQLTVLLFSGWCGRDGGDVRWVMALNIGHQQSPSLFLCLCLLFFIFLSLFRFFFFSTTGFSYGALQRGSGGTCMTRMNRSSSFFCLHLYVFASLQIFVWGAGHPHVCWVQKIYLLLSFVIFGSNRNGGAKPPEWARMEKLY